MASIQLRVCAELAFWPATPDAICDKVSPRRTTCVPSLSVGLAGGGGGADAARSGSDAGVASAMGAGAVAAAACAMAGAGAGAGVGGDASAIVAVAAAAAGALSAGGGAVSADAGTASAAGAAAATAAAVTGAAAAAAAGTPDAVADAAGIGIVAGAGASAARAIVPSCEPPPTAGALSGALATCDRPGVNTGGSSSMVYSRTSLPRAQFTSTSSVTKGSEIGSVDLSLMTSRPSPVFTVFTCTPERYGGQSSP